MKRLVSLLLALVMFCMASYALAATGKPGDTVTVSLSITGNAQNAAIADVRVTYDTDVFEFVSNAGVKYVLSVPQKPTQTWGLTNGGDPLGTGIFGTVTLRIKEDAPAGTYKIKATAENAFDGSLNTVSLSVSGGSVTIEADGPVVPEQPTECTHTYDKGVEKTPAACGVKGEMVYTCTLCGETKSEEIPAKEHAFDAGKVTTEAGCTTAGVKTATCTLCGETKTEDIPATGHAFDAGKVTTEPTCTTAGVKTATCTLCGETATEDIPATGHAFDAGKVTTEPTCTTAGVKTYTCAKCGETKTEAIPAKGHVPGEWVVTKEPVKGADGEEQRSCTVCGAVLETRIIAGTINYTGRACSMGLRFRDVTDITDEWDMFTPISLTEDGTQEFTLIARNKHKIGTVTVTVADGNVTVSYKLNSGDFDVTSEFMTILPDLASVTSIDHASMTAYAFGEPISIADDLNGDDAVLLYICNGVAFTSEAKGLETFWHTSKETKAIEAELQQMID